MKNSSLSKTLHQNSLTYQINSMIFLRRFEVVSSDLVITKNCNRLQTKRVVQLERNAVTNAQYHRRELVEINPVPPSISDEELELNICKTLSLTGHEVKSDDLKAYHRLKKKESVIVKFKCWKIKRRVLVNRKNPRNRSEHLGQLKFSGKLFILESRCHENHQLAYKSRQLKNAGKIHSTWFWNNSVNVKLSDRSNPIKVFHIIDIEKNLALIIWMNLLATLHFKFSHLLLRCVFHFMFSPYSSNFL